MLKSEDIPSTTQLFTPSWIVQYLVQNSVGRLWRMVNPGSTQASQWPCYISPPSRRRVARAAAAFERGEADERQTRLLLSSATALGGSRPKVCFVQDAQKQDGGTLAVARLPSVFDRCPVAKAEMLLGQLAREAGIRVVDMALKNLCSATVLITQRLDRDMDGGRKPYLSEVAPKI